MNEEIRFFLLNFLTTFAFAIADFEGFFRPGSRARRNANPGNLKGWDKELPKDEAGFDIFPSLQEGTRALLLQIIKNINRNLTIKEFFCGKPGIYPGYDPGTSSRAGDAGCTGYASFVASRVGIRQKNLTIIDFLRKSVIEIVNDSKRL